MSGILCASTVARELKRTTITAGDDGVSTIGYIQGLYGSIGSATFNDAAGNSRTVRSITWDGSNVQFWLTGASVPNTAATFGSITLIGPGGAVTLGRAAATYNGSAGGGTASSWVWSSSALPGSSGQNVALSVQ